MTENCLFDPRDFPKDISPRICGLPLQDGPKEPYRTVEEGAVRRYEERARLTPFIGRFCERVVTSPEVRQGIKQRVEVDKVRAAASRIRLALRSKIEKRTLGHSELGRIYEETFPEVIPFGGDDPESPMREDLQFLFDSWDRCLDLFVTTNNREDGNEAFQGFSYEYDSLPYKSAQKRYLVDGALIIAQEIIEPSLDSRWIVNRNVGCTWRSQHLGEFDAVLIDRADWKIKSRQTFAEEIAFPWEGLRVSKLSEAAIKALKDASYGVLEIKTTMRANKVSGPNKLGRPVLSDFRAVREKIAQLVVAWRTEHHSPFPLPNYIQFLYLRGVQDNIDHRIKIDRNFIFRWQMSILNCLNRDNLSVEEQVYLKDMVEYLEGQMLPRPRFLNGKTKRFAEEVRQGLTEGTISQIELLNSKGLQSAEGNGGGNNQSSK